MKQQQQQPPPQKSKKKSVPWYLKPYDPNDPLSIPMSLRRILETPEQVAKRRAFSNKMIHEERERVRQKQQEHETLSRLLNKNHTKRLVRKAAREERRPLRQQRKLERQEASAKVFAAVEAGHTTAITIKKFTKIESASLIKRSLRTLLKAQKIVKRSDGKTYQLSLDTPAQVKITIRSRRRK